MPMRGSSIGMAMLLIFVDAFRSNSLLGSSQNGKPDSSVAAAAAASQPPSAVEGYERWTSTTHKSTR